MNTHSTLDANFHERALARYYRVHAMLQAQYDLLADIEEEGVIEVTIRSQQNTITLPIICHKTGSQAAIALWEMVGDRLLQVQNGIKATIKDQAETVCGSVSPSVTGEL